MEFSFIELVVGLVGFKICWFIVCDRFWDLIDLLVLWLILILYWYIGGGIGVWLYWYISCVIDVGLY